MSTDSVGATVLSSAMHHRVRDRSCAFGTGSGRRIFEGRTVGAARRRHRRGSCAVLEVMKWAASRLTLRSLTSSMTRRAATEGPRSTSITVCGSLNRGDGFDGDKFSAPVRRRRRAALSDRSRAEVSILRSPTRSRRDPGPPHGYAPVPRRSSVWAALPSCRARKGARADVRRQTGRVTATTVRLGGRP